MELLEGIDLEERLEQLEKQGHYISLPELWRVLDPIVDTLERAHAAGILHRDLKPANIFIMSAAAGGGERLLDFGLARLRSAQPLTAAGMIVGSPSYIAPRFEGARPPDARCDAYSFGGGVRR
jgi:serine/threonine-protein kinase